MPKATIKEFPTAKKIQLDPMTTYQVKTLIVRALRIYADQTDRTDAQSLASLIEAQVE